MLGLKQDMRFALDPVAFAEEARLAHLDPWQKDLLRSTSRRVIINASRQSGKSSVAAVRALHSALTCPGP